MIRLAGFLFRWSLDPAYLDYQEKLLYNGLMAQAYWQSNLSHGFTSPYPSKGLLTYFLPMQAGGRKGWSSKTGDFFCCHGTLVQANAAFNRGIYYQSEDSLYICQYLDSQVSFSVNDSRVTTVSYTHLDVYKRQVLGSASRSGRTSITPPGRTQIIA